ncbi:MAG: hypothetical protein V1874_11110 [Spirochaetota bacterium]
MNKKIFLGYILLAMFFPFASFAQNTESAQNQPSGKDYIIGLKYGKGISYTTGTIAGDGGQKSLFGESESYAFQFFYNIITSNHWLNFSLGKSEKELKTEANYSTAGKKRNYIYAQFIDFSLGYTYIRKYGYIGLNAFYGLPAGSWFKKETLSSTVTETSVDSDRSGYELGISVCSGFLLPVNDIFSIQLGAELDISFTPVYEYGKDKLKSNTLEFIAGFMYKL